MQVTRCKFVCQEVAKQVWNDKDGKRFVYSAKFTTVWGDNPENKSFFAATPSGEIAVRTYQADVFVPGQEYYIDFVLPEPVVIEAAPAPEAA